MVNLWIYIEALSYQHSVGPYIWNAVRCVLREDEKHTDLIPRDLNS